MPHKVNRALTLARLNVPTFVEKVTVDGTKVWRCKLCKILLEEDEKWIHLLENCASTVQYRRDYNVPQEAMLALERMSDDEEVKQIGYYIDKCRKIVKPKKNESQTEGPSPAVAAHPL